MRSAAFILLACLLSVHVNGLVIFSRGRCLCQDAGVKFIFPKQIEKMVVFPPNQFCPHLEIVATLKENGGQKCLNPESKFAKKFIENAQREKRNLE